MKYKIIILSILISSLVYLQGQKSQAPTTQNLILLDCGVNEEVTLSANLNKAHNAKIVKTLITSDPSFATPIPSSGYTFTPGLLTKIQIGNYPLIPFRGKIRFNNFGEYFIKLDFEITDFLGGRETAFQFWKVHVFKPVLISPIDYISLQNGLGLNQKFAFSIAVDGKDLSKYSYKIFDDGNNLLFQENSPIIKLDSVLLELNNVGKNLRIEGYHNDKIFNYYETMNSNEPKESKWTTFIQVPTLSNVNIYWLETKKQMAQQDLDSLPVLPYSFLMKKQKYLDPKTFMFYYIAGTKYIDANIGQIASVRCEPPEFLETKEGSGAISKLNLLEIKPDLEYIKKTLESQGEINVMLEFTIRTKLETSKTYSYKYYTKITK